jgi:hypothetical protein
MVGCSFNRHMYFVASEHVFRQGFVSKLLKWAFAPIARIKGSTDTASAMKIMRAIRRKQNVGLFAEGDMSWNGQTGRLHPTTARLIKASGGSMVTYRLTGGYLSSPRWSSGLRRGKMHGRYVNVYSREQLKEMTEDEISAVIDADLFEDAFEAQHTKAVAFRGKNLAAGLENALYACPSCHRVCTLHSRGDLFYCDCGLKLRYNEYGFFEGEDRPFETIMEWDAWQDKFLRDYILTVKDEPIYTDSGQSLLCIEDNHVETIAAQGTLMLYKDRFVLGSFSVPISKISQMSVHGSSTVVFSALGNNYEIKSDHIRSGRKYQTMFEILTGSRQTHGSAAM